MRLGIIKKIFKFCCINHPMGMFCSCGAQVNRQYNLCPKCDVEEIEVLKKAKSASAKKDASIKRKKTFKKKLSHTSKRAIREIIDTYNKEHCERSTGHIRKSARVFYERLRDSPVFYLLPVRGKRYKSLYASDQKRVDALREKYQYHKGRIVALDERGRKGIIYTSPKEKAQINDGLLDIIEKELVEYLLFERDEISTSKSLCDGLEFFVNSPSTYISHMLRKNDFPELYE